jgi:para-aminobenzoate synthetase/4-amino-4-deoxychorismate lyase
LFSHRFDAARVRGAIDAATASHPEGLWRLRLTVASDGAADITVTPHEDVPGTLWRVAFANAPVDDTDPFLRNKTTHRTAYDTARRGRPDVDDVLLWNTRRELTESTIANVVVEIEGQRCTPPVDCGLLPGVLRAELLDRGDIVERVITRGEVVRAERLWLINSLRGWIEALLVR